MHHDHQVFFLRGISTTVLLFFISFFPTLNYGESENAVESRKITPIDSEEAVTEKPHAHNATSPTGHIDVPITFNGMTDSTVEIAPNDTIPSEPLPHEETIDSEASHATEETHSSSSFAAEINDMRPPKKPRQLLPTIEELKAKTKQLDRTEAAKASPSPTPTAEPMAKKEKPEAASSSFANDNLMTGAFSSTENNNFHLDYYKRAVPQKLKFTDKKPSLPPHIAEYIYPKNPDFMEKVANFLKESSQAIDYLKTKEKFLRLKHQYESIENDNWPDELAVEKEMMDQVFNALDIGIWTWGLNLTYAIPPLKANRYYYEKAISFENYVVVYDSVLAKALQKNFMKEQRVYFQYAQYFWDKLSESSQNWYDKQLKREARQEGINRY